jgi:hypothetical protein
MPEARETQYEYLILVSVQEVVQWVAGLDGNAFDENSGGGGGGSRSNRGGV